jgi:hypothetical protein
MRKTTARAARMYLASIRQFVSDPAGQVCSATRYAEREERAFLVAHALVFAMTLEPLSLPSECGASTPTHANAGIT